MQPYLTVCQSKRRIILKPQWWLDCSSPARFRGRHPPNAATLMRRALRPLDMISLSSSAWSRRHRYASGWSCSLAHLQREPQRQVEKWEKYKANQAGVEEDMDGYEVKRGRHSDTTSKTISARSLAWPNATATLMWHRWTSAQCQRHRSNWELRRLGRLARYGCALWPHGLSGIQVGLHHLPCGGTIADWQRYVRLHAQLKWAVGKTAAETRIELCQRHTNYVRSHCKSVTNSLTS